MLDFSSYILIKNQLEFSIKKSQFENLKKQNGPYS